MIYSDYYSCYRNCYKGICELTYNSIVNQNEYTCKSTENTSFFWWFMIIPVVGLLAFAFIFCCCSNKEDHDVEVRVETQPANVVHDLNQKTKVNTNVTGIAPQGQQVTLPNGQVGIFIPQTLPQLIPANQIQAPQFYLPQPIYQPQQFNRVNEVHTIEMPQMPDM
ncbi:Hypothetical_protein [Hexamita inflata]|uniref:Hypothetical_protein n=1 Tax=Hexamita inflata TaxID=28002 RepID=A0AA86Q8N5_9EUKA|nr:Hypothetical protein HINF_LOCUS38753 [Hexamita inflata]